MAHVVFLPKKTFFYPFGHRPAVCLTSELPPEPSADILLLDSSDARNVLYTIYADLGASSRPLDFTCCDPDPAQFARDILLYTLLANLPSEGSDEHLQTIWSFYYDFSINKETLDMVLNQCQILLDLSYDIDTWNNSKYGTFLRFSSLHSLSTIRKHWTLYIETKNFSKGEIDALRAEFRKGTSAEFSIGPKYGLGFAAVRSAGPLCSELKDIASKHFDHYWRTGVTLVEPDKVAKANEVNPTFIYSVMMKTLPLAYGSDPILPFHLAGVIAPVNGSKSDNGLSVSGLVQGAIEQFNSWCLAFNKRIKEGPSLVIRFLVGDPIAVCRALQYCATNCSVDPGLYIAPWSATMIKLDGGDYEESASSCAPLLFNVIDTSVLADSIGFLNILVPCRPLMQTSPSSVIYTNTSHSDDQDDGRDRDDFPESICANLSALSIILDLIPVSYISNFTSHCHIYEIVRALTAGSQKQIFNYHFIWRIGSLSDSTTIGQSTGSDQLLKFDAGQLANFVYRLYLNMFVNENVGSGIQPKEITKITEVHYSRFTLAYVLRFIKDRVDVDWKDVMLQLHSLIADDATLLLGSNNLQELLCSLHILGVYSFPTFLPDSVANVKDGPLKDWENVPPVVCISFRVPRKSFDVLGKEQIWNPVLHCCLMVPPAHNIFPHYQSFWGEMKADYSEDSSEEPKVTFEEDFKGIRGSSPAVCTFYVPTSILAVNGPQKVALSVQSSQNTVANLSRVLGPNLILFSTELTDRRHVHITRDRPGNPGELQKLHSISFARPATQQKQPLQDPVKVTLDSASRRVAFLTGRANINDPKGRDSLAGGNAVSVDQISPQVMQISVGSHLQTIAYPFSVNSMGSKTRIARKSSYIEIDVKISEPLDQLEMSLKRFPVIEQNTSLSLWNIHYVDLERLPVLDLSSSNRLSFLPAHINTCYCDRERYICMAENAGKVKASDLDVITRMKQTIQHLFTHCSGLGNSIASLSDPEQGGVDTLIFINGVCLDLASHTVVIDACVLPLSKELSFLSLTGQVGEVKMQSDEVKAWKHLLPAFTERCRKWEHTADCEYLSRGIPLVEEFRQSPLCSCGRGKNIGPFTQNENWKDFAPYVTRAAISPLFSVPFVDTFFGGGRGVQKDQTCANCHGPGKPKLFLCAACKNIRYCSPSCQKADWSGHKRSCKKV